MADNQNEQEPVEAIDEERAVGARPGAGQDAGTRRIGRSEMRRSQTYQSFLKYLCDEANVSKDLAEAASVSVLCALEQRLMGGEVEDLEAQLPANLRDLLIRCERHEGPPPRKFGADQLILMVADDLKLPKEQIEVLVRAVFSAVRAQVSEGEADDVAGQLPPDIRALWAAPS